MTGRPTGNPDRAFEALHRRVGIASLKSSLMCVVLWSSCGRWRRRARLPRDAEFARAYPQLGIAGFEPVVPYGISVLIDVSDVARSSLGKRDPQIVLEALLEHQGLR